MNTNEHEWARRVGLVGLIGLVGLQAAYGAANQKITANLAVTNAAGTTNGQTITVNGDVRTFTNNVVTGSSQVLTNAAPDGSKTNLYNQIGLNRFAQIALLDAGSTNFQLVGASGLGMSVTLSAGWGSVTFSTQTVANLIPVRVPIGAEASAPQQTNIASQLASDLDLLSTNGFHESSPVTVNLVGLTNAQTVAGAKGFTNQAGLWQGVVSNSPGISGTLGNVTNGLLRTPKMISPTMTNGVNYGSAFSSPGTGPNSLQLGIGALAGGNLAVAGGYSAFASGSAAVSLGAQSEATGDSSTAVGTSAFANAPSSSALGVSATVGATHTNSTAVGANAATTDQNQVMLGSPGVSTVVNNYLNVLAGATFGEAVTNLLLTGQNKLPAGADVSFGRYSLSTLANGINQDIIVGTNVFVEVSGPTGAFSIEGIAGGRDGKFLIVLNRTGQNMTIATEGGATGNDPVAANRIISLSGADRVTTGDGAALLIYSSAASRWMLISFEP